jgi:SAM-dependent methyltransferase
MKNKYRTTAWLYDVDNRDNLSADIPFYIDYARKTGGEVLELGCGTGRVTMALARHGIKVTGLDLSQEMLAVFKAKIEAEPGLREMITIVHGDMANFNFEKRFSLIITPFRVFQALTEEANIASSLRCIRECLADGGLFIVNVFNPRPVMDERWCYQEEIQWERSDENTGNHVVKKTWGDRIDPVKQIIYPHFAYEVTFPDGREERFTEDLQLKYYYEPQLQAVVEAAGLKIVERFGWYDYKSIGEAHRELIFVCSKTETPISAQKVRFDKVEVPPNSPVC